MSGGEQQMCAIGRGIMSRPKLLMIDELSLGLAPRLIERLTAACLFRGPFNSDIANRLNACAVLDFLDAKGVKDEYNRRLVLVALKRAARQASDS